MPRFYIVAVGHNVLLDRGMADPVIGFVAPRCIRAKSEEDARHRVKIQLLKAWKTSFNRDNKAGTPTLDLLLVQRIKNPLKKLKLSDDFMFFRSSEERENIFLAAENAFKRWFFIR